MASAKELRELRVSRNIPAKDMVAAVQTLYPRFDKPMLSKCEHGDECGVSIPDDAMDLLYATFAPEIKERKAYAEKRKQDRHRLVCRISARLDTTLYTELQRAMEADGYVTAQEWISDMALRYVRGKRYEA